MGKRFGLGLEGGWLMSVPVVDDMDASMQEAEGPEEALGGQKQIGAGSEIQDPGKGLMDEGGLELCLQPMVEGR